MRFIILLIGSVFFLSQKGLCQDYSVPVNYELKAREDYSRYEKNIIDAANWLMAIPLNEQKDKRKEVSSFVVQWVNGSPTVNVEINPIILDFEKKNQGMLVLYMAASAKYVLQNNYSNDMRAKHRAALRDLIKVYKDGKGIQRDKKMEKLIKKDEKGQIDEWLEENLKIGQRP